MTRPLPAPRHTFAGGTSWCDRCGMPLSESQEIGAKPCVTQGEADAAAERREKEALLADLMARRRYGSA